MKILYKTDDEQLAPSKGSNLAAGWDLRYNGSLGDTIEIPPLSRAKLPTGLKFAMDKFTFGKIEARSGLSLNHGTIVLAGVIDSDYRGDINVLLFNSDRENILTIKKYDRIAQIVFLPNTTTDAQVISVDTLPESQRGELGFGSTGA